VIQSPSGGDDWSFSTWNRYCSHKNSSVVGSIVRRESSVHAPHHTPNSA
jgi:hypothetical protein